MEIAMRNTSIKQPFPQIAAIQPELEGVRPAGFEHVEDHLERFGYLDPGRPRQLDAITPATVAALARYQQFNSLSVSGRFDEATREAMVRPRCGLPDPSPSFSTTTCRWSHVNLTYT